MGTSVQMAMRVPGKTGAECKKDVCPAVVTAASDPRKGGEPAAP
jgi:hypothetical protein